MQAYDIIYKKKIGEELSAQEISFLVQAYTNNNLPDYQMSAFLMAVCFQKMTPQERAQLTLEMLNSGDKLDLSSIPGIKVDKHSTGGVGDGTSLLIAPIVAAAGGTVPMMSGKGLGHTGGTSDKLESISGYTLMLEQETIITNLKNNGLVIMGQSENIAPADKKLYALRDVTATVESIDLISASIMSKKLAEGMDALVLDVKTGNGAFMKNKDDAIALAQSMVEIGTQLNKKMFAYITDMNQPLGNAVGNSLEIIQAINILKGKQEPADLIKLVLLLSARMLVLSNIVKKIDEGVKLANKMIESGKALDKFKALIKAQNGDPNVIDDYSLLPQAKIKEDLILPEKGYIIGIDTLKIGTSAVLLGAGREKLNSQIDYGVGYILHKKLGDKINVNESILTIYANDTSNLEKAKKLLLQAFQVGKKNVEVPPLVYGIVTKDGYKKKSTNIVLNFMKHNFGPDKANEIIDKILNKEKLQVGFKEFLENTKQEGREYKEMAEIMGQFAVTGKVSKEDAKKVYTQLLDTLKLSGSAGLFILPGGGILLVILIKLAERWNISILPTAFDKREKEK